MKLQKKTKYSTLRVDVCGFCRNKRHAKRMAKTEGKIFAFGGGKKSQYYGIAFPKKNAHKVSFSISHWTNIQYN